MSLTLKEVFFREEFFSFAFFIISLEKSIAVTCLKYFDRVDSSSPTPHPRSITDLFFDFSFLRSWKRGFAFESLIGERISL